MATLVFLTLAVTLHQPPVALASHPLPLLAPLCCVQRLACILLVLNYASLCTSIPKQPQAHPPTHTLPTPYPSPPLATCCRLYAQIMVSLCLSVLAPMLITQVFPALVGFNTPLRGEQQGGGEDEGYRGPTQVVVLDLRGGREVLRWWDCKTAEREWLPPTSSCPCTALTYPHA